MLNGACRLVDVGVVGSLVLDDEAENRKELLQTTLLHESSKIGGSRGSLSVRGSYDLSGLQMRR
jgi:hypothetical protein